MAEHSGFFDSNLVAGEYDRVYLAEHFAKYFANFIGNGVFGGKSNELMVMQNEVADMSVKVMPGFGFINGYFYENDNELSLPIDVAHGSRNRFDSIVLRWSRTDRVIKLAVKKGAADLDPSPIAPERNDDIYELEVARIRVDAGVTNITQANIIDVRLNSDVCGIVAAVVDHLDTTEYGRQLDAFIEQFAAEGATKVAELVVQLRELIDAGDVGPLINEIENLKAQSIESAEHPGCYYKVVNGIIEWINPPNEYGIEYKLTERFENKPVYQAALYVAALANNSFMNVRPDFPIERVVSVTGMAYHESNYSTMHPFPVYVDGGTFPSAVIQSVGDDSVGSGISIRTTGDMRAYKAIIIIKYTKS